jgi:hypothetical protein
VSGTFVTLERPGGGGMGVVYRTYDEPLDRDVPFKTLRKKSGRKLQANGESLPAHRPKAARVHGSLYRRSDSRGCTGGQGCRST